VCVREIYNIHVLRWEQGFNKYAKG